MQIKNVLITNDDGIFAEGLEITARVFHEAGYNVLAIAPDRERSATGHAMTMERPVRIKRISSKKFGVDCLAYSCDALPTDCVIMGVEAVGFKPDLVVSGVNIGPNLAEDITYSGTVCAALEGLVYGFSSMAVSLICRSRDTVLHFDTASEIALQTARFIEKHPMPENVMYNINVPNESMQNLHGIKFTKQGCRRYLDKITAIKDQFGRDTYWIGGKISDKDEAGSDITETKQGYASITPVQLDMTDYSALNNATAGGYGEQIFAEAGSCT